MCLICETWLTDSDDDKIWVELCDLNKNELKLDCINRQLGMRGGGIAIIYRDSLICRQIKSERAKHFEFGIWTLTTDSKTFTILVSWSENQGILFFIYFSNIFNELDIFHGYTD